MAQQQETDSQPATATPQDVLRRMLNTPPKQHKPLAPPAEPKKKTGP